MATPVTETDEYICNLNSFAVEVAKNELRETEQTRENALQAMRNWIVKNPRLEAVRYDSIFLLRFLRFKKFSLPQAQEAIERYLLLRQAFGIAFRDLDHRRPNMEELLNLGYLFPCPERDSKGRRIIVARPGVFNPHRFTNEDMCRVHGIVYETLMEEEESQIHGFVHFADGVGVSFPHLTLFTPKEAIRIVKNGEKTLPMRHKEGHVINAHPSLKFAVDFGFSLIPEKMRKRVHMYTSMDEVTYEDKHLLPKEYGGTMPMQEMIDEFKKKLILRRDLVLLNDKMTVRLDMYSPKEREGAVSALKHKPGMSTTDETENMIGMSGSFRKLEVD